MIGRKDEIKKLEQIYHQVIHSQVSICFIAGQAGVGKTTLLETFCRGKDQSTIFNFTIYKNLNSPFAPLANLIRYLIKTHPHLLETPTLPYLHFLLPEINQQKQTADQTMNINAMAEIISSASEIKPLILILEDLHNADASTLELLPGILQQVKDHPILFIGTYRLDINLEDSHLLLAKNQLRRNKNCHEIMLDNLSQEETEQLLQKISGELIHPELTRYIYEHSLGLPYFAEAIFSNLLKENLLVASERGLLLPRADQVFIPATVHEMIALQLDELSNTARKQVEIASLLGAEFEMDLLNEIFPDHVATDELLRQKIIYEKQPGVAAFKHILYQEDIKNEILWSDRKSYYQKIAEVLEKKNIPGERLGEYWLQAGRKEKARDAFARSANHYCSIQAFKDSARVAQKALDLWPRGDRETERNELLARFSQCAMISGQVRLSTMALKELVESAENQQVKAEQLRNLATNYALQGSWQIFKNTKKEAAELFEDTGNLAEAAVQYFDLANRHIDELEINFAKKAAEKSYQLAGQTDKKDLRVKALSILGYVLAMLGESKEGQQKANLAVSQALQLGHIELVAYTYRKLAGTYEYSSEYGEAIKTYQYTLNFCQQEKMDLQATFCLSCMSWIYFRLGDWKKGLLVSQDVLEDKTVNDASKATASLVVALIKIYRGEKKPAEKYLQQSYFLAQKVDFRMMILLIYWGKAAAAEWDGKVEAARSHYLSMLDFWQQSQEKHDILVGLFFATAFFAKNGFENEINRIIPVITEIANDTNNPEAIGSLSFAIAEISSLHQHYQEASEQYLKALDYFSSLNVPLQTIVIKIKLAIVYRKLKERPKALQLAEEAISLAEMLGARTLLAEVKECVPDTETNLSIPETSLTPRQLQILKSLVDGLSNKEIAALHTLSTRTVDMHVTNILTRFNCRTRTEAVKIALEQGIIS